jgi:Ca-activated chloride channel family protein
LAAGAALAAAACGAKPAQVVVHRDDKVLAAPEAASLVRMTVEPTVDLVRAEAAGQLAVRIRVEAPPLAAADRAALNLALVLDTSASMEGEAIDQLKRAAHAVVAQMADHDRLSLVTFSSKAVVALESTALAGPGRAAAEQAIDAIRATGTTDLASGIGLGLQQVTAHRAVGSIDRMVLVADGFPNDPAPIPSLIASASANAIPITTLGIGIEASDQMLGAIAKDTGGAYRYAPDATAVAEVFRKEVARMQTLVARDMSVRVVAGPGVELGSAAWITGDARACRIMLGDLAAGEVRDVFVPLAVPGHRAGLTVELVDVALGFVDALAGQAQTREAFVGVKASDDADALAAAVHVDVEQGEARAMASGAIITAINQARAGDLEGAREILTAAEHAARDAAARLDDAELIAIADRMVELTRDLMRMRVTAPVPVANGLPTPSTPPVPTSESMMTTPPATAPADVEPALREAYEDAKTAVSGR